MDKVSESSTNLSNIAPMLFGTCLLLIFYRLLRQIRCRIYRFFIVLKMTHVGKDLCAACKEKASGDIGFTEEHLLKFETLKEVSSFSNIKFLNSFGKDTDERFKVEYVNGTQCFTIHDCGCLQNIAYHLMSNGPIRLVCQPSSDYKNVLVEGNMGCVLDPKEWEFTDIDFPPDFNRDIKACLCLLFKKFITQGFMKFHYTKGNITFGENNYVNAKASLLVKQETAKSK